MKWLFKWTVIIFVIAFVFDLISRKSPDDSSVQQEAAKAVVDVDRALTDCFRQTLNGQRAFELTQPLHPDIRYYGQLSAEDDTHKAAWLVVNACPYEAAAWDEKCRDSGTDATTCVIKSSDRAQEAIEVFEK